jgi:hypothetical protein
MLEVVSRTAPPYATLSQLMLPLGFSGATADIQNAAHDDSSENDAWSFSTDDVNRR